MNTSTHKNRVGLLLGILLSIALLPIKAYADGNAKKAEYLVRFAAYVSWSNKPKVVEFCVVGNNKIKNFVSKEIKKKNKSVRFKLKLREANQNLKGCEIAFISKNATKKIKKLIKTVPKNTLTVSDSTDFLEKGGIIMFYNKQLKFKINLKNAKKANIIIRSQLIRITR